MLGESILTVSLPYRVVAEAVVLDVVAAEPHELIVTHKGQGERAQPVGLRIADLTLGIVPDQKLRAVVESTRKVVSWSIVNSLRITNFCADGEPHAGRGLTDRHVRGADAAVEDQLVPGHAQEAAALQLAEVEYCQDFPPMR